MGNGMATLARATAIADRYGSAAYGTIASAAAAPPPGPPPPPRCWPPSTPPPWATGRC